VSIVYIDRYGFANVIKILMSSQLSHTAARPAVQGNKPNQKIVLVCGARLAALMIEHNLGVSTAQAFALKRLDTDFFEED
jgi:restriction endonuclease Mrr